MDLAGQHGASLRHFFAYKLGVRRVRQDGYHACCFWIKWGKVSRGAATEYSKKQRPIMKYQSSPSPTKLISKSLSFSDNYNYWKLLCNGITISTV